MLAIDSATPPWVASCCGQFWWMGITAGCAAMNPVPGVRTPVAPAHPRRGDGLLSGVMEIRDCSAIVTGAASGLGAATAAALAGGGSTRHRNRPGGRLGARRGSRRPESRRCLAM